MLTFTMREWIATILSDHPYTGAAEIVEVIKAQTREAD